MISRACKYCGFVAARETDEDCPANPAVIARLFTVSEAMKLRDAAPQMLELLQRVADRLPISLDSVPSGQLVNVNLQGDDAKQIVALLAQLKSHRE